MCQAFTARFLTGHSMPASTELLELQHKGLILSYMAASQSPPLVSTTLYSFSLLLSSTPHPLTLSRSSNSITDYSSPRLSVLPPRSLLHLFSQPSSQNVTFLSAPTTYHAFLLSHVFDGSHIPSHIRYSLI